MADIFDKLTGQSAKPDIFDKLTEGATATLERPPDVFDRLEAPQLQVSEGQADPAFAAPAVPVSADTAGTLTTPAGVPQPQPIMPMSDEYWQRTFAKMRAAPRLQIGPATKPWTPTLGEPQAGSLKKFNAYFRFLLRKMAMPLARPAFGLLGKLMGGPFKDADPDVLLEAQLQRDLERPGTEDVELAYGAAGVAELGQREHGIAFRLAGDVAEIIGTMPIIHAIAGSSGLPAGRWAQRLVDEAATFGVYTFASDLAAGKSKEEAFANAVTAGVGYFSIGTIGHGVRAALGPTAQRAAVKVAERRAWKTLGLKKGATPEQIRQAFVQKVKDLRPSGQVPDPRMDQSVREAYDLLSKRLAAEAAVATTPTGAPAPGDIVPYVPPTAPVTPIQVRTQVKLDEIKAAAQQAQVAPEVTIDRDALLVDIKAHPDNYLFHTSPEGPNITREGLLEGGFAADPMTDYGDYIHVFRRSDIPEGVTDASQMATPPKPIETFTREAMGLKKQFGHRYQEEGGEYPYGVSEGDITRMEGAVEPAQAALQPTGATITLEPTPTTPLAEIEAPVAAEAPVGPSKAKPVPKRKKKVRRRVPTKRAGRLEKELLAVHEKELGPIDAALVEAEGAIQGKEQYGHDIFVTSFVGALPTELREALQGRANLRMKLRSNVAGATGEDALKTLGTDEYVRRLEHLAGGKRGAVSQAIDAVEKLAKTRQDAELLLKVQQYRDVAAGGEQDIEQFDTSKLTVGDTFEAAGDAYVVTRHDADAGMLEVEDGITGFLVDDTTIPIDKGTFRAAGAKRKTNLLGEEIVEPISGKTADLGIGIGDVADVAVGETAVKPTLVKEANRLITAQKDIKSPRDLYMAMLQAHGDRTAAFFNQPLVVMPEVREAYTQATKGGALFAGPKRKAGRGGFAALPEGLPSGPELVAKVSDAGKRIDRAFWLTLQPAKLAEKGIAGPDVVARVMEAVFTPEAELIKWSHQGLSSKDGMLFREMRDYFEKFSAKQLETFMLARGRPRGEAAKRLHRGARGALDPRLRAMLKPFHEMANFNYRILKRIKADVRYIHDYFYGVYKNPSLVNKFLKYWQTTERFTKHKAFPSYADAADFGLKLRDTNPVDNLSREFVAISRLNAMLTLKADLMRTGQGLYIDEWKNAPREWVEVQERVFKDVRVEPDLALLINNLISTNKISQSWALSALREVNNASRSIKFLGSGFHHLVIAKQAVADNGPMGFLNPMKWGAMAKQVFSPGFKKHDPVFLTPEYQRYVRGGGDQHYSMEIKAKDALNRWLTSKDMNALWRGVRTPVRLATAPGRAYVNWLFERYIPQIKYAKYLQEVAKQGKKLGRALTAHEEQRIIKEGQNFYGEMNERLFGRTATMTSVLRFMFMAPGFREGNYRTPAKGITQADAGRSRWNIPNSLFLTALTAAVGTYILTGEPPDRPTDKDSFRDLFKIKTPWNDPRDRTIYIDLLTYDKDYWNQFVSPGWELVTGHPGKAVEDAMSVFIKTIGGMEAPTASIAGDLLALAQGKAVVDWRGKKITYITDPTLQKLLKYALHWAESMEPISASVARRMITRQKVAPAVALVTAMLGVRPSVSEHDKNVDAVARETWELRDNQEMLYQRVGSLSNPRAAIAGFNKIVDQVLASPYMTADLKRQLTRRPLRIDVNRLLRNQAYRAANPSEDDRSRERAEKVLKNFEVDAEERTRLLMETRKGALILAVVARLEGDDKRVAEIVRNFRRKGEKRIIIPHVLASIRERRGNRLRKAARLWAQGKKTLAREVVEQYTKAYPTAGKITIRQVEVRAKQY